MQPNTGMGDFTWWQEMPTWGLLFPLSGDFFLDLFHIYVYVYFKWLLYVVGYHMTPQIAFSVICPSL